MTDRTHRITITEKNGVETVYDRLTKEQAEFHKQVAEAHGLKAKVLGDVK